MAALIVGAACRDPMGPESGTPDVALAVQAEPTPAVRGAGSTGSGLAVPTANRQDFDLDISWELDGRLFYRDWSVVRMGGGVATITVDGGDPSTYFTAFRNASSRCSASSRGIEVDGLGRLDTGDLIAFTLVACDNTSGGSADVVRMLAPDAGYDAGGALASGDLVKQAGTPPSPVITQISGVGAIGAGTPTLGSDRQEFDFNVASTGGRFTYADYTVIRNSQAGRMSVDPASDPGTAWTSYHHVSAMCVRFGGIGRIDTGELWRFYVDACDNGSPESGLDRFAISLPDRRGRAVPYTQAGSLTAGDIAANGAAAPALGSLAVTTTTTGSSLDSDGYTVALDGAARAIAINETVTYTDVPTGLHSVVLSGVAPNCTVSGGTSRAVTVTEGQRASTSFAVTCSAPATALRFTVHPSDSRARVTIHPPVRVTALDAQGNVATSFNGVVALAIGRNGGLLMPGKLLGITTLNAVNGEAVFADLAIDQIGNGYTLVASATGLSSAESLPFNVSP